MKPNSLLVYSAAEAMKPFDDPRFSPTAEVNRALKPKGQGVIALPFGF